MYNYDLTCYLLTQKSSQRSTFGAKIATLDSAVAALGVVNSKLTDEESSASEEEDVDIYDEDADDELEHYVTSRKSRGRRGKTSPLKDPRLKASATYLKVSGIPYHLFTWRRCLLTRRGVFVNTWTYFSMSDR